MAEDQQKIKVIIADQQVLFRQGIRSILNEIEAIEICSEADKINELISAMNTLCPDVALIDINLNTEDDQDLAKSVKQMFPSVAIVLITPKLSDDELFQAIKSRASGYLSRSVSPNDLITTIRRAARGEHPINDNLVTHPQVAEKVLQQLWADMKNQDIEAIEKTIAKGFQSVHQFGSNNREQEIDLIKGLNLGNYILSDIKITQNGPVIVATYFVSVEETIEGKRLTKKPAPRLSVFLKTDSGWQWIAHANLKPMN